MRKQFGQSTSPVYSAWREKMSQKRPLTPEQKLIWAILENAFHDLAVGFKGSRHTYPKRLFKLRREQALSWIFSEEFKWPGSFVFICRNLSLDPPFIRTHLGAIQRYYGEPRNARKGYGSISSVYPKGHRLKEKTI